VILVLEGEQYTFKTTIAEELEKRGWYCIRPFRRNGETRAQYANRVSRARKIRVPANRFQEDIIVAEVLRNLKGNFILDRSTPSGLAYAHVDISTVEFAMSLWLEALKAHQGGYLVIDMVIDLMVDFRHKTSDRDGVDWDNDFDHESREKLADKISSVIDRHVPHDRIIRFDATGADREEIIESILKQISDVSMRAARG